MVYEMIGTSQATVAPKQGTSKQAISNVSLDGDVFEVKGQCVGRDLQRPAFRKEVDEPVTVVVELLLRGC